MEKEQKAKSKPSFISDLIVPPALIPIVFHTPFLRSLALARVHALSRNFPGPKERVYLVSVFHFFLFFLFFIAKFDLNSSLSGTTGMDEAWI